MPKRKGDFKAWRSETLADPINAANYLTAALEDSPEIFLDAVKDVIQARTVSKVAAEANVTRESLYRSFSATGNPTLETLSSVLHVLGVKLSAISPCDTVITTPSSSGRVVRSHRARRKYRRRGFVASGTQLGLQFDKVAASLPQGVANIASLELRERRAAQSVSIGPKVNFWPGFISQQQYSSTLAMGAAQ